MSVFEHIEFDQHEQVSFFNDPETGLKAIIAVHSTNLGPALGGCRMWDYASDADAVTDVLRLSRGMSYKAAITGLPLGGGKSVIIGDAKTKKTPELMRAMGRCVEKMSGRYIVAEDVGMCVDDMVEVAKETQNVVGLPMTNGQGSGDPSPLTAYGVLVGMKAAVRHRLKTDLSGITVSVQGLGHVGYALCELLHAEGAKLIVTDMQVDKMEQAVSEFGATAVGLDEIYDAKVDVYAPCALGGTVNDQTIARLKCTIIAGSANNQLATDKHGDILKNNNVLYAPDYLINAGGLINVYYEREARISGNKYNKDAVMKHIAEIEKTTEEIILRAERDNVSINVAADSVAEDRIVHGLTAQEKAA